jgi:hypothetical protein
MRAYLPLLALATLLAGCDLIGLDTPEKKAADGQAIGASCRQAGRALEDCYLLNRRSDAAAIYAGWREMDDYMRENKLEIVEPVVKAEELKAKRAREAAAATEVTQNDSRPPADHASEGRSHTGH